MLAPSLQRCMPLPRKRTWLGNACSRFDCALRLQVSRSCLPGWGGANRCNRCVVVGPVEELGFETAFIVWPMCIEEGTNPPIELGIDILFARTGTAGLPQHVSIMPSYPLQSRISFDHAPAYLPTNNNRHARKNQRARHDVSLTLSSGTARVKQDNGMDDGCTTTHQAVPVRHYIAQLIRFE